MRNKTFIIGCGRLGAAAAVSSYKEGENVYVLDSDAGCFERLPDDFGGITIHGEATDLTLLEKNGVKDSKTVLIATGDDNTNIFLAHIFDKLYETPNIYVRLDDPERKALLDGYNVKCIYPFELSYKAFLDLRKGERR